METANLLPSFTPAAGDRLVVVGGCGGMGRALVAVARRLGVEVAVLDIARAIEQFPPPEGAWAMPCDVCEEAEVAAAFDRIRADWGRVDALVKLAGYTGERMRVEDMTTREWDDIVDTDLRGMFLVARACAPLLRASAAHGRQPAMLLPAKTLGGSNADRQRRAGAIRR